MTNCDGVYDGMNHIMRSDLCNDGLAVHRVHAPLYGELLCADLHWDTNNHNLMRHNLDTENCRVRELSFFGIGTLDCPPYWRDSAISSNDHSKYDHRTAAWWPTSRICACINYYRNRYSSPLYHWPDWITHTFYKSE